MLFKCKCKCRLNSIIVQFYFQLVEIKSAIRCNFPAWTLENVKEFLASSVSRCTHPLPIPFELQNKSKKLSNSHNHPQSSFRVQSRKSADRFRIGERNFLFNFRIPSKLRHHGSVRQITSGAHMPHHPASVHR